MASEYKCYVDNIWAQCSARYKTICTKIALRKLDPQTTAVASAYLQTSYNTQLKTKQPLFFNFYFRH